MEGKIAKSALIHFSGGCDSTLSAAFCAERFEKVYLMTYDRFSFIGALDHTQINYEKLCRMYGSEKFIKLVHPIGRLHKRICYDDYFYFLKKYGIAVVGLSFSKLSMHWRSAVFCLENGITTVADGAVPYMGLYFDQNKTISIDRLKKFYASLGITYENPVFDVAEDVEQLLYDKGITNTPNVRGTENDKQIFYAEQVVFALFVKYYVGRHGMKRYEDVMSSLYDEKISRIEKEIGVMRKIRS